MESRRVILKKGQLHIFERQKNEKNWILCAMQIKEGKYRESMFVVVSEVIKKIWHHGENLKGRSQSIILN